MCYLVYFYQDKVEFNMYSQYNFVGFLIFLEKIVQRKVFPLSDKNPCIVRQDVKNLEKDICIFSNYTEQVHIFESAAITITNHTYYVIQ